MVGWFNLCQLDEGYPEGPDVCLVVIRTVFGRFAHHHLWGHPVKFSQWVCDNVYDNILLLLKAELSLIFKVRKGQKKKMRENISVWNFKENYVFKAKVTKVSSAFKLLLFPLSFTQF